MKRHLPAFRVGRGVDSCGLEMTADLASEMGHTSVARTFITYGMWADELGQRAANLRDAWADSTGSQAERNQ